LEYKDIDLAGAGSSHRARTSKTYHISSTGLAVTGPLKAKAGKNQTENIAKTETRNLVVNLK
jgi:hypothetical protein